MAKNKGGREVRKPKQEKTAKSVASIVAPVTDRVSKGRAGK